VRRLAAVSTALACLALAACRTNKPASVRLDPALEALVPADAVFVAGANVDAIRDTPIYQKLLSRAPLPQLQGFTRKTGLDPRRDLSEVLSCSNGKRGLLLARGKFRTADLEARLEANGASRIDYKKYRLFGNEQGAIFFLNDSTAIAGPAGELRSIIDSGSGAGRGMSPALGGLIRSLPSGDQIFAALTGGLQGLDLAIPEKSNLGNIAEVLQSVSSATIGMNLSNGFDVVAHVQCKTERDAKFVHDMLRGVIGLGRLNTPDGQPELLKLYDAIQVTQQQTATQVTAAIPQDSVDRFLDLWLKH
jgi:hypothetical protein